MHILIVLLPLLISLHKTRGASKTVNHTIDDEDGDSATHQVPTYIPNGSWNRGDECTICAINATFVDIDRAFHRTWHDLTWFPGNASGSEAAIVFNFTGIAIYVYNTIVNRPPEPHTITLTNLSFHIDGENVGSFTHAPEDTNEIWYRFPVYVNTSLENAMHQMEIRAGGTDASLVLFDYAKYTTEENDVSMPVPCSAYTFDLPPVYDSGQEISATPSGNVPSTLQGTGMVVWIIGGGLFAFGTVVVVVFVVARRRRTRRRPAPSDGAVWTHRFAVDRTSPAGR